MIAFNKLPSGGSHKHCQAAFIAMLPTIRRCVTLAFRRLRGDDRRESIQAAIANAFIAYSRLVQKGKAELAYPTVLARYAIVQVRAGRRVGSSLNVHDVLSPYAQRKKNFSVERLGRLDQESHGWMEAIVEDTHTPVFDQVCFRIDFPDWLSRLPHRRQRIAEMLALGHSTQEVAQRFAVSAGRVSQLRRALHDSWNEFQGESDPDEEEKAVDVAGPCRLEARAVIE